MSYKNTISEEEVDDDFNNMIERKASEHQEMSNKYKPYEADTSPREKQDSFHG